MARAALEAALRRNPDDEHSWTVLGDLLASEGDARSELIALEQRAATSERPFDRAVLEHRAAELFEREHRRWLGPLAEAGLDVTWVRGYATEVVITRRHAATLERLLELPAAALLRKLVFVRPSKLDNIARLLAQQSIEALELRAPLSSSLEQLAALEQLRELTVDGGSSEGIEALAGLPQLHELSFRRCQGPLTGLAGEFAALRSLELSARPNAAALGRGPEALAPIAGLTHLQRLSLQDGGWSDLEALAELRALELLDLRSTDVAALAPLSALDRLRALDLSGCTEVTRIDALAGLHALERLELAYTRVRRLQPLAGLRKLEFVELSGTPVRDLSPLFGLPALRKLAIAACEVDSVQPLLERGVSLVGVRPPEPSWRELAEDLLRGSR